MADSRKVLIVGAGIGGLTAATALSQHGVETVVIDKKPDNLVAGVGLNLPGNALRALAHVGLQKECLEHGYTFDRIEFRDINDQYIVTIPSFLNSEGVPPNCALQRRDLAQILENAAERSGAAIHYSTTVSSYVQDDEGVQVTFSNGATDEYDLMVGFDGIRSELRESIFDATPRFSGYSVWRVALDRRPEICHNLYFQGMGNKAGIFPLNDKVMYLLHVTPEPGNPWHDRSDFAECLRSRLVGYTGRVGDIRDALKDDDDIVYAPIEEVFLTESWYRERVLILGDAAHAMAPHRTQGAAMAIEDGVVLGEMFLQFPDTANVLSQFMERRYARCKLAQDASRNILLSEMNTQTSEKFQSHKIFLEEQLPEVAAGIDCELNKRL